MLTPAKSPLSTHIGRLQSLLPLMLANASVRALNNFKDMAYTMMLADISSGAIDYVTPYTRSTIVALFLRACSGLLEVLDNLINKEVGKIEASSNQKEIAQCQHAIQRSVSNAYVLVGTAILSAQALYHAIGPCLRGIDRLLSIINDEESDPAALEEKIEQVYALGYFIRLALIPEFLSLPALSLLLAYKRQLRVFMIGITVALLEGIGMYIAINTPKENMTDKLSDYGKVFCVSMSLMGAMLIGAVKLDPELTHYLRPKRDHFHIAPLKKLFELSIPIMIQFICLAIAMYFFSLCVIDPLSKRALATHFAPRRILYPLSELLPTLARSAYILMSKHTDFKEELAQTTHYFINAILTLVGTAIAFFHQPIARLMIGRDNYDPSVILPVFMVSVLSVGCFINSLACSFYLMSMQITLLPAVIKSFMLAVVMPIISFIGSRMYGLIGAEIGVGIPSLTMATSLYYLYRKYVKNGALLDAEQRSDAKTDAQDTSQTWHDSLPTQLLFTPPASADIEMNNVDANYKSQASCWSCFKNS